MIKISLLAVLLFTAGMAFGGQYISCNFSESDNTYGAVFSDEEATDLYYQIGALQKRVSEVDRGERNSVPPCEGLGCITKKPHGMHIP